jgi:hypothetical protein
MPIVGNLYDSGPISPIAQIKEHLAIWTDKKYVGFQVENIEPIPRSGPYTIDLLVVAQVVNVAAFGTVQQNILPALQVNQNELFHARWFPLDDLEGQLFELGNMPRYNPRGGQARTTLLTDEYDPYLATTTFWVLGGPGNKDAQIGAYNPQAIAQTQARFAFFGFRYILSAPLPSVPAAARYLPAEGF